MLSTRLNANMGGLRAGAQAVSLAADPVNREILLAMSNRVLTMRGRQYTVSNEGYEALFVAATIERWLGQAPDGPIEYGTGHAKRAVAALVEAWSATVVHALAREPMTTAELDAATDGLRRRRLLRLLAAMRALGMVERLGDDGDALYAMTDWLRLGIAPLIVAARLERDQDLAGANPAEALDIEAGFRMALVIARLPEELSGSCHLRINLDEGRADPFGGVTVAIDCGEIDVGELRVDESVDARAVGTLDGWLDTVIDPAADAVRASGDAWLPGALVRAIHKALFAAPVG